MEWQKMVQVHAWWMALVKLGTLGLHAVLARPVSADAHLGTPVLPTGGGNTAKGTTGNTSSLSFAQVLGLGHDQ